MRTDPHSPSNIRPDEYEFVMAYSMASTYDGHRIPPWNLERLIELRRSGAKFADIHPGSINCDVCGAWYMHGEVWMHGPTGEHVTLGHTCAEKYRFASSLLDAERRRYKMFQKDCVQRILRRTKRLRLIREFKVQLKADPELVRALRRCREDKILKDLLCNGLRFGSLSDRQISFAKDLARRLDERFREEEFLGVPSPGRHEVGGTILATKTYSNDFGTAYKMLVAVEDSRGDKWKAWGTIPRAVLDQASDYLSDLREDIREAQRDLCHWMSSAARTPQDYVDVVAQAGADGCKLLEQIPDSPLRFLRGKQVRFAATFEPSAKDDPHFARFSRPSKASAIFEEEN